MDEKNLFRGQVFQDPSSQPTQVSTPEQAAPSTPPISSAPVSSFTPSQGVSSETSSEPIDQSSSLDGSGARFSAANIIKLLIGLFAVFVLLIIIFGLVIPNIGKKEQKSELTFWDVSDTNIQSVLPDFEKQNPNIKVNYSKQDIKDYKDRLVTRSKNGTGPDIFRFHNTWVLQLSDILLPIPSDVITRDEFNRVFYPVAKHDLVKNGAIYGIPLEIDTLSLFVNSAMLKQYNVSAPTNWNDSVPSARALTLKDQNGKIKSAGVAMGTFDNITHAPDIISLLFAQDSVNLDDISQTKSRVVDALNFYTAFAKDEGSVWDSTLEPSLISFSKGNLAMYFGYYKDQLMIKSANPNISFDVLNVPHLAGQNTTIASYYPIGISLNSKHQKEALLLLKFLSQKSVAEKLTSLPYARMDLPDRSKGQTKDSVSSFFSGETFDNGLNSQLNSHLSNAISSILSGGSSDSAADNLILGFSQVLNQFLPKSK